MTKSKINYLILFVCLSVTPLFHMGLKADVGAFLILNDTLHSGFGAEFSAVLGALDFYEKGNYAGLRVEYSSGCYLDPYPSEPNWWNYYFEPINLGNENHSDQHHFSLQETITLSQTSFHLPRERNAELIQRYVHVRPEIQFQVESYFNKEFAGHYVIGVHHRGTDKALEVAVIAPFYAENAVNNIIKNLKKSERKKVKIYVATDDQHFLDFMIKKFGKKIIYNNFVRSTDDRPLHYGPTIYSTNYERGRDAIVDALLLSKTHILVRPAPSAFSWMSIVFNPHLPVIFL